MAKRPVVLLVAAVALGGASVFLARQWLTEAVRSAQPGRPAIEMSTVVVARVPLSFGNKLALENLKVVAWPADARPDGSFTTLDELISASEERVVLRSMEPGEPVLATKVSGFGGRATLSTIIDESMRAVTIRVDDVNGVAGFVLPGDRVDIMITREVEREKPVTDVLLQSVKVLGVDQEASDQKDKPVVARAVTLEVTPVQAQKLTLGQTVGSLSLSLRNQLDADATEQRTVTLADLGRGEPVPAAPEPAAAAPVAAPAPVVVAPSRPVVTTVRVVRGTKATEEAVGRGRTPAAALAPAPAAASSSPASSPAPAPAPVLAGPAS